LGRGPLGAGGCRLADAHTQRRHSLDRRRIARARSRLRARSGEIEQSQGPGRCSPLRFGLGEHACDRPTRRHRVLPARVGNRISPLAAPRNSRQQRAANGWGRQPCCSNQASIGVSEAAGHRLLTAARLPFYRATRYRADSNFLPAHCPSTPGRCQAIGFRPPVCRGATGDARKAPAMRSCGVSRLQPFRRPARKHLPGAPRPHWPERSWWAADPASSFVISPVIQGRS